MGHTVWSQRIALDILLSEIASYGRSLRQKDRVLYEGLLKQPLKHIGSISFASSIHLWAFLLLSIMLEQEKRIKELEDGYESLVNGCIPEGEFHSSLVENT